jgi:hypothetical protein
MAILVDGQKLPCIGIGAVRQFVPAGVGIGPLYVKSPLDQLDSRSDGRHGSRALVAFDRL